jgi:hypothetical protein
VADEQPGRLKQIRMVASLVNKSNPRALPLVIGAAVGTLIVVVVIGLVTGELLFFIPLAILGGLVVGMFLFGRVAQRAQYNAIDGQPGAAASVLESSRMGNWSVTPGVQATRSMDVVHRVIGRPGIVLVSEGPSARVGKLLAAEKKRVSRAATEVPIYEVQVGREEGQVPLSRLQRHMMKLPRNLKKDQISAIIDRMNALPTSMQMPKGPLPRGARMPKAPKPRAR